MNIEFLEAMEEMAKNEGIEREVLYEAVHQGIKAAYIEEYGIATEEEEEEEEIDIEVDIDRNSGDIQIKLADRVEKFDLRELGRIATRKAQDTIHQEIVRYRRDMIYERYHDRVGEIINGSVHRFEGGNVWINLGQAEALLPEKERIPGERYQVGATLRAYLFMVERTGGDPRLLVSRAHAGFVESLLSLEVPELERGLLKIEAIAREPGTRTKVAIRSLSPDIDPVGTCVGPGGTRIKGIVRELHGEKVDVVRWSEDVSQLIDNSLAPSTVIRIHLNKESQYAQVVVRDDELSLAIGKGGQNVRLTAKLTGYQIDVTSPQELERAEAEAAASAEATKTDASEEVETTAEAVSSDEVAVSSDEVAVSSDAEKVSSDEVAVSSDEVVVSSDEVAVSSDEVKVSSDEVKVSSDEVKVSSDEVEVSSDEVEVSSDEVKVSSDEVAVSSDEVKVSSDEVKVSSDEDTTNASSEPAVSEETVVDDVDTEENVETQDAEEASTREPDPAEAPERNE